jgi:hypothetical protein
MLDANDSLPNLLKYAIGRSPSASVGAPHEDVLSPAYLGGRLTITFNSNTDAADITWIVEATSSLLGVWEGILTNRHLAGWTGGATYIEVPLDAAIRQVTVSDTDAAASARFMRLRVTKP